MPRDVVGRIKLKGAVYRRLDPGRGIDLIPAAHVGRHFSVADRRRKLRFGIVRSEGRGALGEFERDVPKAQLFLFRRRVAHQVAILPRDPDEKIDILRFELVRRQIDFERFFGLELFVELVAFSNQSVDVFCPRRSAREAKHRTKQPESAKEMIRIHECK